MRLHLSCDLCHSDRNIETPIHCRTSPCYLNLQFGEIDSFLFYQLRLRFTSTVGSITDFPNLPPDVQQEILNGPGLPPPEGVKPDFTKPENQPSVTIGVSVVCLALVTFSVAARAYSRVVFVRKLRVEDCRLHTISQQTSVISIRPLG